MAAGEIVRDLILKMTEDELREVLGNEKFESLVSQGISVIASALKEADSDS